MMIVPFSLVASVCMADAPLPCKNSEKAMASAMQIVGYRYVFMSECSSLHRVLQHGAVPLGKKPVILLEQLGIDELRLTHHPIQVPMAFDEIEKGGEACTLRGEPVRRVGGSQMG